MRNLTPSFILSRYSQNEFSGSMNAVVMFIDISGFTSLTEKLMSHSKEGAEILTEILNSLFSPMSKSVTENGGFISSFAGDAFTAIFPGESPRPALNASKEIIDLIRENGTFETRFGRFDLSCRSTLDSGRVEWRILRFSGGNVFYFKGKPVTESALLQKKCLPGEMLLSKNVEDSLIKSTLKFESHSDSPSAKSCETDFSLPALQDIPLEGEFRDVASLFISFEEFTEEATEEFLKKASAVILSHGGYRSMIDFGDKGNVFFSVFGAPKSYEDNLRRALDSASALKKEFGSHICCGISFGTVFSGFLGNSDFMSYTVIGDKVNLAARLMSKASPGEILFSEDILSLVSKSYKSSFEYSAELKGKSNITKIYSLKEPLSDANSDRELEKLFGRDIETERLLSLLSPLKKGESSGIIRISGEMGSGKTLFILHASGKCSDFADMLVVSPDRSLMRSLSIFENILRRILEAGEADDIHSFSSKWEGWIARAESAGAELENNKLAKSIAGSILGFDLSDTALENLPPKERHEAALTAIKSIIIAEAKIRPLIISIDNFTDTDKDSIELLNYILRNTEKTPIGIILICRSSDASQIGNKTEKEQIDFRLDELSSGAMRELAEFTCSAEIPDEDFALLEKKSDKNPFFMKQMLLYLLETGRISVENGKAFLTGEMDSLPSDINSILVSRIDRMSLDLKSTAQAASVFGMEFDRAIVEDIASSPVSAEMIEIGTEEHLWYSSVDSQMRFFQNTLRDAAYGMLLRKNARVLHQKASSALRRKFGRNSKYLHAIAYHYEASEKFKDAVKYYIKAGDFAYRHYHNEECEQIYGRVIAIGADKENYSNAMRRLAEIKYNIGKWEEAKAIYLELLEKTKEFNDDSLMAMTLNLIADMYRTMSKWDEALQYAEEALEISKRSGHAEPKMHAEAVIGLIATSRGDKEIAESIFLKQIEEIDLLNNDKDKSIVYSNISNYYWNAGDHEKAIEYCIKSIKHIKKNALLDLSAVYGNLGGLYWYTGRLKESSKYFKRALKMAEKINQKHFISIVTGNMGNVSISMGKYDEALAMFRKKEELCRETADRKGIAYAQINIGAIYLLRKNYDEAEKFFLESLAVSKELGVVYTAGISLGNLAELYADRGLHDKALELIMEKLHLADSSGNEKMLATTYSTLGDLFMQTGGFSDAIGSYEKSEEVYESLNMGPHQSYVLMKNGEAKMHLNMHEDAEKLFFKALDVLTDKGYHTQLSNIYFRLSILYEKLGKAQLSWDYSKKSVTEAKKTTEENLKNRVIFHNLYLGAKKGKASSLNRLISMEKSIEDDDIAHYYYYLSRALEDASMYEKALSEINSMYQKTKRHEYAMMRDEIISISSP